MSYKVKFELSVRRKPMVAGVPGDDVSLHNMKIGGSFRNNGALGGLTQDEEKVYLPELIGMSSASPEWNRLVKEYWNNISAKVPADGTGTDKLQGLPLRFEIEFESEANKEAFVNAKSFEEKGIASQSGKVVSGIREFVLFRYCLGYSRVANEHRNINKSAKIWFYLYSKKGELAAAHSTMKVKLKASAKFQEILIKESMVDAMLRMFGVLPEIFEDLPTKHMDLYTKSQTRPAEFIKYSEDKSIIVKGALLEAVEKGILHQPTDTNLFYFGDQNEVLLGKSLEEAVLWWRRDEEDVNRVKEIIKAKLKTE